MKQLLTVFAIGLSTACAGIIKQKPLTAYVEQSAPVFMEAQRKKFGFCYGQVPGIDFEHREGTNGNYFARSERIALDPKLRPPRKIAFLRIVDENDIIRGADRTLHHELVHSYIRGLCKSLDLKGCAFFSDSATPIESLSISLVDEGAASFVAGTMTYRRRDCTKFRKLKPKIEDYSEDNRDLVYGAGYCVAREVVGKYRDDGLRHMLGNPPTEDELRYPYSYAKRMERELRVLGKR